MSKKQLSILLLVLIGLSLVSACGVANEPKAVAEAFLTAIKNGDLGGAANHTTEEMAMGLRMMAGMMSSMPSEMTAELEASKAAELVITGQTINGDTALVSYTMDGVAQDLEMVKENGNWKAVFNKEI